MHFLHFEVHVIRSGRQYLGSWRLCQSHNLDQGQGDSLIPLGKRMTQEKLEDFCLDAVARASQSAAEVNR